MLTVSESSRVILRELMPTNLIEEYVDTLTAGDQSFSEKDIEEAKKLLEMVPIADEKVLVVSDFRAEAAPKVEAPKAKVQQLEQILATVK